MVFGQVVPAGADSVRLSATIYDVRRERSAAEVEVRDNRQRIDRIADTLAVRLLREVGRTRPVGAVRFASLGSTSLPAIKLFLAAEQFYRRGQWHRFSLRRTGGSGRSDFTLALRRIPTPSGGATPMPRRCCSRAGVRNHGLAPRESLLVSADSTWGALDSKLRPPWPLLRQLNATVRETVRRYPEDPEAWYMMGELAYHDGGQVAPRVSHPGAFDAFARALELDSAFAPAYEHIVDLALRLGTPDGPELRRSLPPSRTGTHWCGFGQGSPGPAGEPEPAAAGNGRVPRYRKSKAGLGRLVLHRECGGLGEAAVVRREPSRDHGAGAIRWIPSGSVGCSRGALAYRGHLREAARELWTRRPWTSGVSLLTAGELVTLAPSPPDSAAAWLESLLGEGSVWSPVGLAWWSARGDTDRFAGSSGWPDPEPLFPRATGEAGYWTYQALAAQPYLALARRDTSLALTLLAALPDSLCRTAISTAFNERCSCRAGSRRSRRQRS